MLLTELNSEFDVLFEELATNGSKGLDMYEKSLCYTFAQSRIVDDLIKTKTYSFSQTLLATVNLGVTTVNDDMYGDYCKNYNTSPEIYKVLGYVVRGKRDKETFFTSIPGIEVDDKKINDLLTLPYKYPPKDLAYVLRVQNSGTSNKIVTAVFAPFKFAIIDTLFVKCILTPTPIILEDFSNGETIGGLDKGTKPILDEFLRDKLVEAAVLYAIDKYVGMPEREIPNK